jgi:hypothetical protein
MINLKRTDITSIFKYKYIHSDRVVHVGNRSSWGEGNCNRRGRCSPPTFEVVRCSDQSQLIRRKPEHSRQHF